MALPFSFSRPPASRKPSPAARPVAAIPPEHVETARKLGLGHLNEALLCAPDRYEDYRHALTRFNQITREADTVPVVVQARLDRNDEGGPAIRGFARKGTLAPAGGFKNPEKLELRDPFSEGVQRLDIQLVDELGHTAIYTAFGGIQAWRHIQTGQPVVLRGLAARQFGSLRFRQAELVPAQRLGTVQPVYLAGGAKAVNGEAVTALVSWVRADPSRLALATQAACTAIREDCAGFPDAEILARCTPSGSPIRPATLAEFLQILHAPASLVQGQAALTIAAKICALGLQCRAERINTRPTCADAPIPLTDESHRMIAEFEAVKRLSRPDFALTENQVAVVGDILAGLQQTRPLNGLLSGEVGSGKTAAYLLPAVAAHRAGAQVAIIAPTTLLADQIFEALNSSFPHDARIERVKTGGKIRNPAAILVGTPGLGAVARKAGYVPNFLILDEQHKFHTAAREDLVGPHTHTLDVSATPIPRSLALSLYGGMDLFTLNEQPVEKEIHTMLIDVQDRRQANAALRKALSAGKRCAVIFTLVDPTEGTPAAGLDATSEAGASTHPSPEDQGRALKAALDSAALFEEHFPGKVALLHGKMKTAEKNAALDAFRAGDKPLLVTTTIFETGIDVPSVEVLIVRDPQQLGVSQLHQLRGRLARDGGTGYCFLLTESIAALSDDTRSRLTSFCEIQDGYELARQDMLARGAGDLDGLQQKGKASTTFKGIRLRTEDLLDLPQRSDDDDGTVDPFNEPRPGALCASA